MSLIRILINESILRYLIILKMVKI